MSRNGILEMRLAFFSCIFSFLFDLATVELSQTGTADEAEDSLPLGFCTDWRVRFGGQRV